MNIAIWNVRGFNEPSIARETLRLINEHKIGMFMLLETNVRVENLARVLGRLGKK